MFFPLIRLPSLTLDHIINVMDPMEQVLLCRTSRKMRNYITKLTKNHTFHMKCYDDNMSFGHGGKSSTIHVRFESPAAPKVYGQVYNTRDGKAVCYHFCIDKAFDIIGKSLTKLYEPKTVVCSYIDERQHPLHDGVTNPDSYDLILHEVFGSEAEFQTVVTMSKCVKSTKRILQELADSDYEKYFMAYKNVVDWMTLEDFQLVKTIQSMEYTDRKIKNEELNRFLKKWMTEDLDLITVHFKLHNDYTFDIQTILEDLGAELIVKLEEEENLRQSENKTPKYRIKALDGKKTSTVWVADNTFYFNLDCL